MKHELSPTELQEIITYTGLDLLMLMPEWNKLPVVHFCRDRRGVVQFITILKDLGVSDMSTGYNIGEDDTPGEAQ